MSKYLSLKILAAAFLLILPFGCKDVSHQVISNSQDNSESATNVFYIRKYTEVDDGTYKGAYSDHSYNSTDPTDDDDNNDNSTISKQNKPYRGEYATSSF